MPKLRLATLSDYAAIHEIWMQPHVLPYMSFVKASRENFQPLFEQLMIESEVYVLEDDTGTVVGVRRIIYGTGEESHTACFASFGIHEKHLNKGYATVIFNQLISILKAQSIQRVEISQEGTNDKAFEIAKHFGFKLELNFPGWLYIWPEGQENTENKNYYNIPERFLAYFIDENLAKKTIAKGKIFEPKLPTCLLSVANSKEDVFFQDQIQKTNLKIFLKDELQATITLNPGVRRFDHILFLSIHLEPEAHLLKVQNDLCQLLATVADKFKKVEVYTDDQKVLDILANLGFQCRGEKIGSIKRKDSYYNQIGADLNFYDINDAKIFLKTQNLESYYQIKLTQNLTNCKQKIDAAFSENKINKYGALYLENLAYQLIQEKLFTYKMYPKDSKVLLILIENLPDESFKSQLIILQDTLTSLDKIQKPHFSLSSSKTIKNDELPHEDQNIGVSIFNNSST